MLRRPIFKILFALSLVVAMGSSYVSYSLERSPIASCNTPYGFIQTNQQKYYTSPQKVVVQPWRGQHHVYAVFEIPKGYQHEYLFRFQLPGETTHCGGFIPFKGNSVAGITPQPGHYLIKGYLNTRIALSLIFQGKLNQLEQLDNWQVGYVKKFGK